MKKSRRLQRACQLTVVGGIGFVLSQPVAAVTKLNQTFTPYVGSSHTYDSNVLRASDKNSDPSKGKTIRDSFIHQIRAGLNVDWHQSRQQVIFDAQINQNWYTSLSQLDYFGHSILAQWNWQVGNDLKGELGYRHSRSLSSFSQLQVSGDTTQPFDARFNQFLSNMQNDARYFANAEYQILPSIYLKAGFLRTEWLYDGERALNGNQIQNNGEFKLQYRNLSKTMVGFRAVITDGQYPRRPDPRVNSQDNDNAFFRSSYYLDWEWKYSDKLHLDGFVGYVQQDYKHLNGDPRYATNLNFSDAVARFDLIWMPSEKSKLIFSAWREINQAFTRNATFVLSQGVNIIPAWIPTSKIRVELPMEYQQQDYLGGATSNQTAGAAAAGPQRSDEVVDIGLNLIYTPWINTEFALNVKHEDRSSNIDTATSFFSYDAQSVGISAKVEF